MSKFAGVFLAITGLIAGPACAQQTTFTGADALISHIVDGDGWKTSISLNNIDASPSQYKISFFAENGTPLSLQTNLGTGTFVYGTIPARGTVVVETAGTKVTLSQGWAKMETIFQLPGGSVIAPGATLAGTVLFLRPPTVPRPIEVSEPLDFSSEWKWVLPFDHLNGYSSGVALVNQDTTLDISVFVSFFDEAGNQIGAVDAFTLLRGNHLSFTVTDRYPLTVGKRGTIKIESSSGPVNVLGLRVSTTGYFTSISPIAWF